MEDETFTILDESDMFMEKYYIGLLSKGPAWTNVDSEELDKLEEAHLANLRKLQQSGKLVAAGPCPSNEDLQSIYLFKTETMEEAAALVWTDPMVQQRRLTCDMYPWVLPVGLINHMP